MCKRTSEKGKDSKTLKDAGRRRKKIWQKKEESHARVYIVHGRPTLRIAYARACICKRAAHGATRRRPDRVHEVPRARDGIRRRKREERRERVGVGGWKWTAARRRRGGWRRDTSDSNYLELRADDPRSPMPGFSCRATAHAMTLLSL